MKRAPEHTHVCEDYFPCNELRIYNPSNPNRYSGVEFKNS